MDEGPGKRQVTGKLTVEKALGTRGQGDFRVFAGWEVKILNL
jgi:hypothetical protein